MLTIPVAMASDSVARQDRFDELQPGEHLDRDMVGAASKCSVSRIAILSVVP
jgi:hypothetical protein